MAKANTSSITEEDSIDEALQGGSSGNQSPPLCMHQRAQHQQQLPQQLTRKAGSSAGVGTQVLAELLPAYVQEYGHVPVGLMQAADATCSGPAAEASCLGSGQCAAELGASQSSLCAEQGGGGDGSTSSPSIEPFMVRLRRAESNDEARLNSSRTQTSATQMSMSHALIGPCSPRGLQDSDEVLPASSPIGMSIASTSAGL